MTEHTNDATFMTIREIVKEMREEQKDFKKDLQQIRDDMVTKREFREFQKEATVTRRFKIGTSVSLIALALSLAAVIVTVM